MDTDRPIDATVFAEYAEKVGIRIAECPSCHTKDPGMIVHDNGAANTSLAYAKGTGILSSALPVATVECAVCGYLWLYNRLNVIARLRNS